MDQEGIRPNLDTLNSVLETLSNMSSYKNAKTFATQLLAEFKMLGITPSLASFYHLINLFGSDSK